MFPFKSPDFRWCWGDIFPTFIVPWSSLVHAHKSEGGNQRRSGYFPVDVNSWCVLPSARPRFYWEVVEKLLLTLRDLCHTVFDRTFGVLSSSFEKLMNLLFFRSRDLGLLIVWRACSLPVSPVWPLNTTHPAVSRVHAALRNIQQGCDLTLRKGLH